MGDDYDSGSEEQKKEVLERKKFLKGRKEKIV